jgi:predicted nucleic acid-binding protein
MTPRFADSFYFLALLNEHDAAHGLALRFADEEPGPLVTTAWVLTEVADAMAAPSNRPLFLRLMKGLQSMRTIEFVPADQELFNRGLDLYERRPDKAWSLTDCISFVVMTERGLTESLTGDHHFEQAGFRAVLKKS